MSAFITEDRKAYEEEFSNGERLEHERSADLIREFKSAIRERIGSTWLGMTWAREVPNRQVPMPIWEIEQALDQLADELRQWDGVKTRAGKGCARRPKPCTPSSKQKSGSGRANGSEPDTHP